MSIKETVAIEITSDTGKAVASVNELREAIKKTNNQTEELRNQRIDDAAKTVTALSAAYGGLQGALELTGMAGEDTMKQLAKIQSALAIGDAIQNMVEFRKSIVNTFTMLTKLPGIMHVIKAAQWLWNAAMSANPIGTLVVAITALIAGVVALVRYFKSSADAAEAQAAAIKKSSKAIDQQKKALDESIEISDRKRKQEMALAKASGMSADALRKKEIATINESIAVAENSSRTALNTVEKQKNYLATLKQAGAEDEQIKAQEENLKKAREVLKTANDNVTRLGKERIDIVNRQEVEILQEQTDANKKRNEDAKKSSEERKNKAKEEAKAIKDANDKANQDILKLQQENTLARISDEKKRAEAKLEIDLENAKKDIENTKASAQIKAKQIQALEEKYMLDLKAIQSKNAEEEKKKKEDEDKKKLEEQLKAEKETFDIVTQARLSQIKDANVKRQEEEALRYQTDIDNLYNALNNKEITEADFNARREALKTLHEGKMTEIEKVNAEEQKKIAEAKLQHQQEMAQAYSQLLSNLSEVVGKETEIGKGLAIASATINTYQAANSALKADYGIFGPAAQVARFIAVATTIAAGIKNVKAIAATNVPGEGGGGMPSISATAPIAPQMSQTALNQELINQTGNAATRAFVLESDVSGNQERIRRLNRAARIN